MTPEVFAEWLRRQGHRVVRTRSSYWFDLGPRVYQAFPYHAIIQPSEEELMEFLREENAIGLRYSTPLDAEVGTCSYHVVYDRPAFGLKNVEASIRSKVRRGLEACTVGPIPLARYAAEGWSIEVDTRNRQGRQGRRHHRQWTRMVEAAEGLEGFEVWGAEVEGRLAATLMFVRVDEVVDLLYQQSRLEFLPLRVNNALVFAATEALVARPGVQLIHNGLHSLDAPSSVDQFKLRHGYTLRPLRQRVVFHPLLAPRMGLGTARVLEGLARLFPERESIQKAEGLTRFYLNGLLPLPRQVFPDNLEASRDALCAQHGPPSLARTRHTLADGQELTVAPATARDQADLVALHRACFSEAHHAAMRLGPAFMADAYRWFLRSPGTLVLAARIGDRLVGLTALADRPYNLPMLRACKATTIRGLLRKPWLVLRPDWVLRMARLVRGAREGPARPEAQIAFTCIAPDCRGLGISALLKQASLQACRDWGVPAVTTAVRRDNPPARAMNERFGFVAVEARSSQRMLHLRLDLSPPAPPDGAPAVPGFRRARPADLPGIVATHQAAFPDFFMTALGPRFLASYYRRVLEYPGQVFWVKPGAAHLEGFVSGFINPVAFYQQMKGHRFAIALIVATRVLRHPRFLPRLVASYTEVWRSIQEDEPETCELSSIAVRPECAGRGVGQGLADAFIAAVRGKAKAIVLTTDAAGNEAVNRFYTRLGFVLEGTYERSRGRWMNRYRLPLGAPGPER